MNLKLILEFFKKHRKLLFWGIPFLIIILIESKGTGDLDIFIQASNDLFLGKNIYVETYHEWYHYYYDASFAILVSPLRYLSLYWANFCWLAVNLFFSYRILIIAKDYLPVHLLTPKQVHIFTFISCAFVFALWLKNIHLTQMTIFILYLCLEGMRWIDKDKFVAGAVLISFGITVKIVPIVLIPYLIYRSKFKATLTIFIVIPILLFLPALFIGLEYNSFLLQQRWLLINPTNSAHILDVAERSFHSLTTLCTVLLLENTGEAYALPLKRNVLNLDLETLNLVINAVRLVVVGATLLFLRSKPFSKSKNKLQTWYELSYILLIAPLIFPHQQHYSFFFILPAVCYLVFYSIRNKSFNFERNKLKTIGLATLSFVIFFLLSSDLLLGEYREIYDHFKTLTYGVLLLIPLLFFWRPEKINLG